MVAALAFGCAEAPKSGPAPDERIDKTVFALVPVRAAYVKSDALMADEDARKVENALRIAYAPVECKGNNARLDMNLIMGASRGNPDNVRRNGRSIVVLDGGVEGVTYKDCHVVGSSGAGAATFLRACSRAAKTDAEFA
jgi:hypothetical protein